MRARVVFGLVLLLPFAGLAGCFDGDTEPLAQESETPPSVPRRTTPRSPTSQWNFNDPGYTMNGSWWIGDGWDYESNQSHYRRVRVIDQRTIDGVLYFITQETFGKTGNPADGTITSWIDSRTWTRVNATDGRGVDKYIPGQPQRYFRNGTTTYNVSRLDLAGRVQLNTTTTSAARLYATHQTLLFPWGYVEAKRVEQTTTTRDDRGQRTNTTLMRWVQREYLNDVQYQVDGKETFKLVAVKAGDFRRGTLVGHGSI